MKKYLIFICSILVLFGCSNNSIYKAINSHDTESIIDKIEDIYKKQDNDELIKLATEIVDSYAKILKQSSEEEISDEELNSYIDDLEKIKINYSFLISTDDIFTQTLTNLKKDFNELASSRYYMEQSVLSFNKTDFDSFLNFSHNITLFDKFSMEKLVDLTSNKMDNFYDTVEFVDYSVTDTEIEYTIRNNKTDKLETVLFLYFVYDKNGNPVELDSYNLCDNRIKNSGYKIERYINIEQNSTKNKFIPYFHEANETKVIFIPIKCEFVKSGEVNNNFAYVQIYKELLNMDYDFSNLINYDSFFKYIE